VRLIFGGEDEAFIDAHARDALIGAKSGALQQKARALLEERTLEFECAWSSTFGGSPDGLPAIGQCGFAPNIWLAYGYGGNGVTFAALASDLIGDAFAGRPNVAAHGFDPYRFAP
jgi:glycine/D-amino acid oxidase-like deaminating enzyme